jgi:hypothetical protein
VVLDFRRQSTTSGLIFAYAKASGQHLMLPYSFFFTEDPFVAAGIAFILMPKTRSMLRPEDGP